jgi:hypothetical protein
MQEAHLVRDKGVAGSNPATPTNEISYLEGVSLHPPDENQLGLTPRLTQNGPASFAGNRGMVFCGRSGNSSSLSSIPIAANLNVVA